MFLSDLRAQQGAAALMIGAAACSDQVSSPSHAEQEYQLIADCRALVDQLGSLLDGIECAADVEGSEHERLTTSLRRAHAQVFKLIDRISRIESLTECGVQSKHAVANLLLSTNWYDDPSPYRDALLLSFLRDAQRLHYPVVAAGETLAGEKLVETQTVIASGEACLRLIEELVVEFDRWDQDDMADPSDQDERDAALLNVMKRKRAAVAALAAKPAGSATALQTKSFVLQRLLEVDDSDAHQLRVDLSRSYLGDLNAFVHADEREREAAPASSSLWSTLSSKVRCWIASGHHR